MNLLIPSSKFLEEPVRTQCEPDATNLALSSRVNGTTDNEPSPPSLMMSTLISLEVLEWYRSREQKLRKDLDKILLESHSWCLKSWDHKGVARCLTELRNFR